MTLTDFDPDGETKVVAAALYAVSALPDDQLLAIARRMPPGDRRGASSAPTSARAPTGATSRAAPSSARSYRFDVLADYGAFRDLQRHRLLTLEWQPLGARHGYIEPAAIEEAGALAEWRAVMERSADLHERWPRAGCATSRHMPS